MFESAEIGHRVDKEEYAEKTPVLRRELLRAQYALREKGNVAVLVVVAGVDGAGKGDTIKQLSSWLDTRLVRTHGLDAPSDEERARPPFWRFWRILPPRGQIGVFMGSWYTDPIVSHAMERSSGAELDAAMDRVRHFEQMLTEERVVLLKLWFHLSKDEQRARLKKLAEHKRTRWRVTEQDWERFRMYDRFRAVSERALRQSSVGHAPWLVVSGADRRYRELAVGQALLEALRRALAHEPSTTHPPVPHAPPSIDGRTILDTLDLTKKLEKKEYERALQKQQERLAKLARSPKLRERSVVVVFEGSDAAGKGGAIRRVTEELDPRQYHVVPIAAPTDEERAQPYLWRFWRHLPARGKILVFDRSWYGRVLVERVEGFATKAEWKRAYDEINSFEQLLIGAGTPIVKFFLHISPEEQLKRFLERESNPFKNWKITPEDYRNRDKWKEYERATNDMLEKTDTKHAPWVVVPANRKWYARVHVCEEAVRVLSKEFKCDVKLPKGWRELSE